MTWWLDFWGWLDREHQALAGLSALATVAAVVVAGVYAWLTWRLAHQAKQQAIETRRQADITQRMFDATYRPHIRVVRNPGAPAIYRTPEVYSFMFDLRPYGTVPAILLRWRLRVFSLPPNGAPANLLFEQLSPVGWRGIVYPGEEGHIDPRGPAQLGAGQQPDPQVRVVFTVFYRGSTQTEHMEELTMAGRNGGWRFVDYEAP